MKKVQLLDCTLRDGAYIVDAKFGVPAIKGIIKKLQDADVDIIECGWLKNTLHEEGTSFLSCARGLGAVCSKKKRRYDLCGNDRLGQI